MRRISDFGFRISDLTKRFTRRKDGFPKSEIRNPKSEIVTTLALLFFVLLPFPVFAKCPISPNGTLIVRAPVGNLIVETTGVDAVDVDVSDRQIKVKEECGRDLVHIEGVADSRTRELPNWKIRVPKTVNLDLVGGGITILGDTDASVILRTTGGPVSVRNIRGRTTIVTQGGFIKAGNIGSNAELRSQGNLEVGNVAGTAEFKTAHGAIKAGVVEGRIIAETAGGTIDIQDARAEVVVIDTRGGDISIHNAQRIQARTEGGSITTRQVRGPFDGHTEFGDIKIFRAASWVEASTGRGDIELHMMPDNPTGDNHISLQAAVGDILLFIPEKFKTTIESIVERPAFNAKSILSDFPMKTAIVARSAALAPGRLLREVADRNGGGSPTRLRTSLGTIKIRIN